MRAAQVPAHRGHGIGAVGNGGGIGRVAVEGAVQRDTAQLVGRTHEVRDAGLGMGHGRRGRAAVAALQAVAQVQRAAGVLQVQAQSAARCRAAAGLARRVHQLAPDPAYARRGVAQRVVGEAGREGGARAAGLGKKHVPAQRGAVARQRIGGQADDEGRRPHAAQVDRTPGAREPDLVPAAEELGRIVLRAVVGVEAGLEPEVGAQAAAQVFAAAKAQARDGVHARAEAVHAAVAVLRELQAHVDRAVYRDLRSRLAFLGRGLRCAGQGGHARDQRQCAACMLAVHRLRSLVC